MVVSFKAIGRNIRAARTALDITQEEAADRLKISQLHFGRLERGERPISLEMLAQIASVLDVSLSALLNGEPLFEWQYIVALALVCVGIFLVNRAPQPKES